MNERMGKMAMSDTAERATQGSSGRWLQLGLLSATAAAPMIARWRKLRAYDRAQAVREQARIRLAGAALAAQSFQQSLQRSFNREGASRAMPHAVDRIAPLPPIASADDAGRRAVRASLWLAGVSAGLITAGAVTYLIIRNRALARVENDTLVEISLDHFTSAPTAAPLTSEPPITEAPPSHEPGFASAPEFSDEDGDGAEWVGDIYTRAYMSADNLDGVALPEPDRRIYFASEEQARATGYHRAGSAPDERA